MSEPKEYIITEDEWQSLKIIHGDLATHGAESDAWLIMENIHSRSHPAPALPLGTRLPFHITDDDLHDFNNWLIEHDAAITRKAREDVLYELNKWLDEGVGSMEDCVVEMNNLRLINHTMNKIETFREIIGVVESLREGDP